jgi:hypothetical protein
MRGIIWQINQSSLAQITSDQEHTSKLDLVVALFQTQEKFVLIVAIDFHQHNNQIAAGYANSN